LKLSDGVRGQYKEEVLGLEAGKAEAANRRMLLSKNAATESPLTPSDGEREKAAASLDSLKVKRPAGSAGVLGGAASQSDAIGQRYGVAVNSAGPVNAPAAPPASSTFGGAIVADAAKPGASLESPKAQDKEIVGGQFAYKSLKTSPALAASAPSSREVDTASGTLALDSRKNKDTSDSSVLRSRQAAVQTGAAKLLFEPSAPKSSVLASFHLEREGEVVRIVDADGSVYTGSVQMSVAPAPVRSAGDKKLPTDLERKTEQNAVTRAVESQARQVFSFRAVGTNLSLNEKVVFTGNVVASANETAFKQTTNGPSGAVNGSPTLPAEPSPFSIKLLPDSRVSGRVQIGEGKEIEVNAVPAKP
jgi:hypothetical protein